MSEGWIRLYRKTLDNPLVCKDADHLALWTYLLLQATHKTMRMIFMGKPIDLEPGQLITGRKAISIALKLDEYKVQRMLNSFENDQQIAQQTTPQNRLISILNWQTYQGDAQQDEQQLHNDCTTTAQRLHTNKNVNNVKKYIYAQKFIEFYSKYPRKVAKADAEKAFNSLNIDDALFENIMSGLSRCIDSADWKKENGKYIPYPATWLRGKRWEDETEIKTRGKYKVAGYDNETI